MYQSKNLRQRRRKSLRKEILTQRKAKRSKNASDVGLLNLSIHSHLIQKK